MTNPHQPVLFLRSYPPTVIRHVIRWCESKGRIWREHNTRGGDICGAPLTEEEEAEVRAIQDRYDSPERAEMKAEVRIPRKGKQ